MSVDLKFNCFGFQLMCESNDFVSARLPYKNEALKLKDEPFLRDFLQKMKINEALKLKNEALLRDFLQK